MLGPAKMPVDIVNRLSHEIVASINSKDVTDRMLNEGTVPTPSSPEEFAAYIKSEIQKWGVVIRGANIRVE
jgi:tripartite-type tricarboxylate transporter receptor subunit TctC